MNQIRNIASVLLVLVFLSCIVGNKPIASLQGKWEYTNELGYRAEFWFTEKYVMHIDETFYSMEFHRYFIQNDSLILMTIDESECVASLKMTYLGKKRIMLSNIFFQADIIEFESIAYLDTTQATQEKIYKEFGERLHGDNSMKPKE